MDTVDWWDELYREKQMEIDEGLAQADVGETIPDDEFMKKYDRWRDNDTSEAINKL